MNSCTTKLAQQKRAIFLDRDGTLIVDRIYLNRVADIVYLPGIFDAMKALRDLGYCFLIATNQSGVARGLVQPKNLEAIHRQIRDDLAAQGIDVLSFHSAPYLTDSDHWLRKPNPGMLLEGAQWHQIDLNQSWMVGDRMTDVEAGRRAGCKTALILGSHFGFGEFLTSGFAPPDVYGNQLIDVTRVILSIEQSALKQI